MFIYFLLLVETLCNVNASIAVIDKGLFPLEKDSVALQFYVDIENMDRQRPCRVHTWTKKCCLTDQPPNCDPIYVFCTTVSLIKPKDRKTLVCIYPTVFQHDKAGFCELSLNYRCGHRLLRRQNINITFNTGTPKLEKKSKELSRYIGERKITDCASIDEDSLDNCSPVDCCMKYADEKPYYDMNFNKCVKAATCIGDPTKAMAETAYLPDVNFCRDLRNTAEIQDIYAINNGLLIVSSRPKPAYELVAKVNSNCSTISQNIAFIRDLMYGKLCPLQKGVSVDYSRPCMMAVLSILAYIVGFAALIVSCVCCVHTLVCMRNKCDSGAVHICCVNFKQKFSRNNNNKRADYISPRNSQVKNSLLRDVINRDIPLELRNSVVDVCDRIGREVRWKKRYRFVDVDGPLQNKRRVSPGDSSNTSLFRASDEDGSCCCK